MALRYLTLLASVLLVATACAGAGSDGFSAEDEGGAIHPATRAGLRNHLGFEFPPAPAVSDGPADPALVADLDTLFGSVTGPIDVSVVERIAESGDARAAWLFSDLLRFIGASAARNSMIGGFDTLTGVRLNDDPVADRSIWQSMTDHLIAWDLPALPGYEEWKAQLFLLVDPRWGPFFEDEEAEIDWRFVSWGGVFIDDRGLGDSSPCPAGCIPALDDPSVTDAAGGDWYPDDALVFAVTVNGESRAYPKNIMEVQEMVNDTVGGRRLGIPYCTLCGSAQAYFTDSVPDDVEVPVLRTSGLLTRSNKVMYDLVTFSVFDTFTGRAVSGPLREQGIVLEQTSVITSTWGDWKAAHPETTIVAQDGGINRTYPSDPLRGRDDNGPIFPIGDVDERLGVQDTVFGVFAEDGTPIAFPVADVHAVLAAGGAVQLLGVKIVSDGSGVRAVAGDGSEVVGHQAFWFAWSQFNPDTVVWTPTSGGG